MAKKSAKVEKTDWKTEAKTLRSKLSKLRKKLKDAPVDEGAEAAEAPAAAEGPGGAGVVWPPRPAREPQGAPACRAQSAAASSCGARTGSSVSWPGLSPSSRSRRTLR